MSYSAELLLFELSGRILRELSDRAGMHFQGISQGARFLKNSGQLSCRTASRLIKIDHAHHLMRHLTKASIDNTFDLRVSEITSGLTSDTNEFPGPKTNKHTSPDSSNIQSEGFDDATGFEGVDYAARFNETDKHISPDSSNIRTESLGFGDAPGFNETDKHLSPDSSNILANAARPNGIDHDVAGETMPLNASAAPVKEEVSKLKVDKYVSFYEESEPLTSHDAAGETVKKRRRKRRRKTKIGSKQIEADMQPPEAECEHEADMKQIEADIKQMQQIVCDGIYCFCGGCFF